MRGSRVGIIKGQLASVVGSELPIGYRLIVYIEGKDVNAPLDLAIPGEKTTAIERAGGAVLSPKLIFTESIPDIICCLPPGETSLDTSLRLIDRARPFVLGYVEDRPAERGPVFVQLVGQ